MSISKAMTTENISSNDENQSEDSTDSKDISDTTFSGKDEYSNYAEMDYENENEGCPGKNVELKARSLFFDSIPKRNCKRKRMKRDLLKKAASACLSSSEEINERDTSVITIKAIHIYSKESSISSTFTSENSFQPKEKSPKKSQVDDGKRQREYENIMYATHPHYKKTQLLRDLSQSIADDGPNNLSIQKTSYAKENSEDNLKHAARYMRIDGCEGLSFSEMESTNKEFISSLPRQFLPYIDQNPSMFEYVPITLEKAVGLSSHARFITEARFPFRILHANAGFCKLAEDQSSSILGKPLGSLKENSFLESFLLLLEDEIKPSERNEKIDSNCIEKTLKDAEITGKLPKCFIKLLLVGNDSNLSTCEEKDDTMQVTHFLIQIETNSSAASNMSNDFGLETKATKNLPTFTIG